MALSVRPSPPTQVGVLVQEAFSPFYNPENGPTDPGAAYLHFQKLEAVNGFLFIFLLFGACARDDVSGWEGVWRFLRVSLCVPAGLKVDGWMGQGRETETDRQAD